MAATQRAQTVAKLGVFAGEQRDVLWQVFNGQALRHVIEHAQCQLLAEIMLDRDAYFAPASQRQTARQLTLQARRGLASEPPGIKQAEQYQRHQQPPTYRRKFRRKIDAQRVQSAKDNSQAHQCAKPAEQ